MRVFSDYKEAYVYLQNVLQNESEAKFIAVINDTVVHYGPEGGFDQEKAKELRLDCYNIRKGGGAMVTSPGDVVFCYATKNKGGIINELLAPFIKNKLLELGIQCEGVGNDLIINERKCSGFMCVDIGSIRYYGGHFSINCNLDLIKQICTKPMKKIPGGLAEYGVTTEQMIEWISEFFDK